MTKLEKVLDALRKCQASTLSACNECPYRRKKDDAESYDCQTMHHDAEAILTDIAFLFGTGIHEEISAIVNKEEADA